MTKKHMIWAVGLTAIACATSGCDMLKNLQQHGSQQKTQEKYELVATAKVVSVGKHNLVLEDKDEVLFVSLDEVDKAVREHLKKGDTVKLMGRKRTVATSAQSTTVPVEIEEAVLPDGTRIEIGK